MPISEHDRLFGHVVSITGLLASGQIQKLFSAVELGEARDMAQAATRAGFLAGDVAAAVAILASELAARRLATSRTTGAIVSSGRVVESEQPDAVVHPRALGDYYRLKQIARGAMGVIFRAERRSDNLVVALKVLPPELVREPQDVERFKREIETITSLVHPNIVRVYDFGRDGEYHYYAMEFLDGRSLREMVQDRGPLDPAYAAEIVRDAARGLAFAHQHGVIHRDIKPSNVMVTRDGQVKLVDFGLAFHKASEVLTATGISLGTPAYMSPEQIEGGRSEIGEKSDIYSLGVTLYEAVTGRRPFEGDNQFDVMKRVLFDEAPSAQEANPAVPSALNQVIRRAMAKTPAERYERVGEMIEALDSFVASAPEDKRG